MSLLKKLFGGGARPAANDGPLTTVEHDGYTITVAPVADNGQFRLAGTISREVAGETQTHRFIRADIFATADECIDPTLRKARRIIEEQGERIFQ